MSTPDKIPASDEAWETGQLGADYTYAKVVQEDPALEAQIDEALELQAISIRLQKSLIDDFKAIASLNGVGYQPLMRQVLNRFVDCEKKRILNERVSEMREQQEKAKAAQEKAQEPPPKQKKAA